jgi:hypothetical protein
MVPVFLLRKGFAAGSDQRREFGPRMRRLKLGGQTTQKAIPTLRRNELNPDRQTVRCGVGGKADSRAARYVGKASEGGMRSGTGCLSVDPLRVRVCDRPWEGGGSGSENRIVVLEEKRKALLQLLKSIQRGKVFPSSPGFPVSCHFLKSRGDFSLPSRLRIQ